MRESKVKVLMQTKVGANQKRISPKASRDYWCIL